MTEEQAAPQQAPKRQKSEPATTKKEKKPYYRCEFMIPKKGRTCSVQRKKHLKYCTQHQTETENKDAKRVPCPLDPKHNVWDYDVERHLKRCNAKPQESHEPWWSLNINHSLSSFEDNGPQPEDESGIDEQDTFNKYLDLIRSHVGSFQELEYSIESHSGLQKRLSQVEHQKHPIQQSSLAGNLKKKNMLGTDNFYVEFGCGKAELSRFINLCILQDYKAEEATNVGYGLIDRGVNRMKNDPKIIKETQQYNTDNETKINPDIKRTRLDIKDLDLDKFLAGTSSNNVIAISKHLCGVATDLTLRLILNSKLIETNSFKGLQVAMCCRHVCDYDQLLPLSRQYLYDKGFKSPESFKVMKKIVSWAVSGDRDTQEVDTNGLTDQQRRQYGITTRRLIDESRLFAIRKMIPQHYQCEIFWYVKNDVTLENVCLSIVRK